MPASAVADVRNSLGMAFIGLVISTTLYGLTILQTWVYFWNYRKRDPKALKFFVIFMIVMDTIGIILCAYMVYWYLVLNFGNVESLDYISWALSVQIALGAVTGTALQMFVVRIPPLTCYISNEAKLLRKTGLLNEPEHYLPDHHRGIRSPFLYVSVLVIPLGGTSIIVSLLVFVAFGMLSVAKNFAIKRFSRYSSALWVPCVGVGAVAASELVIAASMCWTLYRKKTGFAKTDSMIMTLMAYSINSGLVTSLLGTAAVISLAVSPFSMIWLALCWVMCQCGINSMLALLNSREYIRGRTSTDTTFDLSSIRHGPKPRQTGVSVTVHHSASSDFSQTDSGPNAGPTFEVPKPDASIAASQSPVVVQL
ncbi:hypothetical protein EDB86DRAFT_531075 [Lactarius hatsudake]|nr:hypothetical protein EDB86DRAFT_531075 [Lactarius hatsudake]